MAPQKKSVREFLDGVSDDKLYDLGGKEHNIAMDMVGGYRLDYQGVSCCHLAGGEVRWGLFTRWPWT